MTKAPNIRIPDGRNDAHQQAYEALLAGGDRRDAQTVAMLCSGPRNELRLALEREKFQYLKTTARKRKAKK